MKKITLTAIVCLLLISTKAQTIFKEQFNLESIPADWSFDQNEDNWSCERSIRAFGHPNELRLCSAPAFTGQTIIISPQIDLSDFYEVTLRFSYLIDHIDTAYTFGIATRSNGGDWNTIWEKSNPNQPYWASDEFVIINNADIGAADFQFCFFFNGSSEDIFNIFIDNVELFHQYTNDIELTSLNVSKYCLEGNYKVKGRITNVGNNLVNDIELSYQIDGGAIGQMNFFGINVWPEESMLFSSSDFLLFDSGERELVVWISDVGFLGSDENLFNDTLSKKISVASESIQRLLLFEEFASSTCVPCSTFNSSYFHPLLENNAEKCSFINYPMNYPDPGDPYFIEYSQVRQDYYGVSYLPHLTTEGIVSGAISQNYINSEYTRPALIDISAAYSLDGNQISVSADIYPFINLSEASMYIAVTEKITTGNIMTNGELEFYNILMEMLPSAEGQPVSGIAGSTIQISYSKDLSASFIEDFSDLEIVVFIQDDVTKEILQSSIADIVTNIPTEANNTDDILVYPNPFESHLSIDFFIEECSHIDIRIIDIHGRLVKNLINKMVHAGHHSIKWNGLGNTINRVNPGLYFIEFTGNGKKVCKKIIKHK